LLEKYKGREDFLMQKLAKKYEGGTSLPDTPSPKKRNRKTLQKDGMPALTQAEEDEAKQQQAEYEDFIRQQRHTANVQYQLQQQQQQQQLEQQYQLQQQLELEEAEASAAAWRQMQQEGIDDSDSDSDSDELSLLDGQFEAAVYDDDSEGADMIGPFSRREGRVAETQGHSSGHDGNFGYGGNNDQHENEQHYMRQQHEQHQQYQPYHHQQQQHQQQQWQEERQHQQEEARHLAREQLRRLSEARARSMHY
jgi:hypothetical protein